MSEQLGGAASVDRPVRDVPFTGDEAVDGVLAELARATEDVEGDLADQVAAVEHAHRSLQERLGR